jgi:nitroreductase
VDTYLTIASRRETRRYSDEPIPGEVVNRILDAGRLAGSGSNRQPWTFYAVESRDVIEGLADVVYAPDNIRGARFVVLVTVRGKGPVSFDAGRAVQNMLLAAWNEGVGGSPNGFTDADRAAALVGAGAEERPVIALSFGYPARPRDPSARPAEEWSRRAKRRPLDDVVVRR